MKKINWYKVVFWGAAIAAIFFVGRSCGSGGNPFSCNQKDTVAHKIDTIVTEGKDSISYVPQRYDSLIYVPKFIEVEVSGGDVQPTYIHVLEQVDTVNILKDYLSVFYYDTVIRFKNSDVRVIDTVTRNKITGRKLLLLNMDTLFKESITLSEKKKNILYVGTSITGNRKELFYGVGWSVAFKPKNDIVYSAGVRFLRGGQTMYEGGILFPIRTKRQK